MGTSVKNSPMSPYFLLETSLLLWKCINFISYDLEPEAFNENHHFQKSVNAKIFEKHDKKLIDISWIRTGYSEKSCIASFYRQPSANIDKKLNSVLLFPMNRTRDQNRLNSLPCTVRTFGSALLSWIVG